MKVIIAGSRTITDPEVVHRAIDACPWIGEMTEVVEGGAKGVDRIARDVARFFDVSYTTFEADWQGHPERHKKTSSGYSYDPQAGPDRNQRMVNYADALIAVKRLGGDNKGTDDCIERAQAKGLRVFIYSE